MSRITNLARRVPSLFGYPLQGSTNADDYWPFRYFWASLQHLENLHVQFLIRRLDRKPKWALLQGRGNFLNIFTTAFLIGFSTLFASLTLSPVGPCLSVSVAVPRHNPSLLFASDISTTSVPFVTGQL